jgi:hypothetical protein
MWRRWREEFEQTRREAAQRHDERQAESNRRHDERRAESNRRHDEWQAESNRRHAEWQAESNRRQAESDRRHAEWQVEHAAFVAEQKRRFDRIDAAMENDKRVTREMILELREGREHDRDMRGEMRAQREGLLRILDEMRRNDGPSAAEA